MPLYCVCLGDGRREHNYQLVGGVGDEKIKTLDLSDATALNKGYNSVEPCRDPQIIMTTRVPWMVGICALVNMRDSAADST